MTSEITAARLQPVVAELHEMRGNMVTKADLAGFATRADFSDLITKADLAEFEARIIRWMLGAMLAQTALIVGLVSLLK